MALPVMADEYQTAPKPPKPAIEKRAVPPADSAFEDWTRIPYVETAAPIVPTAQEKNFGFVLFTRPLVDASYPETIPAPEERTGEIAGFGAWNQFETLNFAIYPLRDLKNVRVTVTDLVREEPNQSASGGQSASRIPAESILVRQVTYRDITYPLYASKGAWRRLPEYLQEVTVCDAVKQEPQRFCLTVKPAEGLKGGIYCGKILVTHDGFDSAVVLPIRFDLMPFKPLRDPGKHFSAYYYPASRHELVKNKVHDSAWAEQALEKEFKTMADYGFDRLPVISMNYARDKDTGKEYFDIPNLDKYLELMKKNGMSGPILVIGGGITWMYEVKMKESVGNHIVIKKLPPPEFYDHITEMAKEFKKKMEEKGVPEMVFGPLDEISANPLSIEFGCGVYRAFQKGGLTTYTTMEVDNPGFKKIDSVIDIFGTQAFMPKYKETQTHYKKAYWCYPNHNTYERKDPVIMCKGGRMTYGFGYWRSGFDLLVPWIWRNNSPKHFHRERGSGGANIFHPETGDMIMLTSWENFREGINDLNYVYTLQDAIVKRENSKDPKVIALVKKSKDLLQEIWDSIDVQEKYLNSDLWPSDQFDARRLQLGRMILALYRYPASNDRIAPSVIVDPRDNDFGKDLAEKIYHEQLEKNNIVKTPIFSDKAKNRGWGKTEEEASVSMEKIDGSINDKAVCLTLKLDQIHDGTGNKQGSYPSGWPGMVYDFSKKENLSDYDLIYIRYRLDSNRKEALRQIVNGPISYLIRVNNGKGSQSNSIAVNMPKQLREGQWIETIGTFNGKFYDGMSIGFGKLNHIRASIAESQYKDGDVLKFYFDEMNFIKLKNPIFLNIDLPKTAQTLLHRIRFSASVLGQIGEGDLVKAEMFRAALKGVSKDQKTLGIWTGLIPVEKTIKGQINLPINIEPGRYCISFQIVSKEGRIRGEKKIEIELL